MRIYFHTKKKSIPKTCMFKKNVLILHSNKTAKI